MTHTSAAGTPSPQGTDAFAPTTQLASLVDAEAIWDWWEVAATAAARNALAGTYARNGVWCLQEDTGVIYRRIAGAWVAWDSSWISYTPTMANITVGSGTLAARYRYAGGRVKTEGSFTLGAGSAVGSGPTFTNPVNADAASILSNYPIGDCRFGDAGIALYPGIVQPINATTNQLYALNAAGTYLAVTAPTASIPFTFGSGDSIGWRTEYTPA